MRNPSRNGLGKVIAIQIAVALAALFIADVFLWLLFPTKLHYEPTTFEQNLPGIKNQIVYAVNQYGFRSLSMRDENKPDDTIRIFCLGASTTDQTTQNTEDTWCALLEKQLNEEYFPSRMRIETASFGYGGWKAIDLYAWARINIERFRPDIVITMMGINDLTWNGGPGYAYTSLEDKLQQYGAGTIGSLTGIWNVCKEYSQVCRRAVLAKWRIELIIRKQTGRAVEWSSRNLPELRKQYRQRQQVEQVTRVPDPIIEFDDAMDRLLSLFQKSGIKVLVLGQPVFWKEEMTPAEADTLWFPVYTPLGPVRPPVAWMLTEMRRYNDVQKRLAASYGASYADLDSIVPKSLENYFDDCHFTDAGSKLFASLVFSAIKSQVQLVSPK